MLHFVVEDGEEKLDPLRLFSSQSELVSWKKSLEDVQREILSGVLHTKQFDAQNKVFAKELYSAYCKWQRKSEIRILIASVFVPLMKVKREAGSIGTRNVLNLAEKWATKDQSRLYVVAEWTLLAAQYNAQPVQIFGTSSLLSQTAILSALKQEFEEKAGPAFSRYFHKSHVRLLLLNFLPEILKDLYYQTIPEITEPDDAAFKELLKPANHATVTRRRSQISPITESPLAAVFKTHYPTLRWPDLLKIMSETQRLQVSFNALSQEVDSFYNTYSSLMSWHKKEAKEQDFSQRLEGSMRALYQNLERMIPVGVVWMQHYDAFSEKAAALFATLLYDMKHRILETGDDSQAFESVFVEAIESLSTKDSLPELVKLINLDLNLPATSDSVSERRDSDETSEVAPPEPIPVLAISNNNSQSEIPLKAPQIEAGLRAVIPLVVHQIPSVESDEDDDSDLGMGHDAVEESDNDDDQEMQSSHDSSIRAPIERPPSSDLEFGADFQDDNDSIGELSDFEYEFRDYAPLDDEEIRDGRLQATDQDTRHGVANSEDIRPAEKSDKNPDPINYQSLSPEAIQSLPPNRIIADLNAKRAKSGKAALTPQEANALVMYHTSPKSELGDVVAKLFGKRHK